jgi:hypothetical protein
MLLDVQRKPSCEEELDNDQYIIYLLFHEDVMKNHHHYVRVIAMVILAAIGTAVTTSLAVQEVRAPASIRQAPPAISGDNVYVAWWTNNTANGNNEVLFRASTDGGASFADKTNLSNTTDSDSERVEVDADEDSVVITWWETNQTDETPVMRVSNDNGVTFGPILRLSSNGTIGEAVDGEEDGG